MCLSVHAIFVCMKAFMNAERVHERSYSWNIVCPGHPALFFYFIFTNPRVVVAVWWLLQVVSHPGSGPVRSQTLTHTGLPRQASKSFLKSLKALFSLRPKAPRTCSRTDSSSGVSGSDTVRNGHPAAVACTTSSSAGHCMLHATASSQQQQQSPTAPPRLASAGQLEPQPSGRSLVLHLEEVLCEGKRGSGAQAAPLHHLGEDHDSANVNLRSGSLPRPGRLPSIDEQRHSGTLHQAAHESTSTSTDLCSGSKLRSQADQLTTAQASCSRPAAASGAREGVAPRAGVPTAARPPVLSSAAVAVDPKTLNPKPPGNGALPQLPPPSPARSQQGKPAAAATAPPVPSQAGLPAAALPLPGGGGRAVPAGHPFP